MEHRRRFTAKSVKQKNSGKIGTVLFVIISVILIAGIVALSPLGDYLMQNVFSKLFSCNASVSDDQSIVSALKQQEEQTSKPTAQPKPSETVHDALMIDEIPFYILQMGVYTDKSNADEHAEAIRRFGAGGYVYQDGSLFRVFAAAYLDENSLSKVQSQVRSDGFEATPYITEKKGLKLTLDGNREAVSIVRSSVQLLGEIPSEACSLSLAYDKRELDESGILSALQKLTQKIDEQRESLNRVGTESTVPVRELLKKYRENISTFLSEHDTINTENLSGDFKHLQLSLIIDYILFFEQE